MSTSNGKNKPVLKVPFLAALRWESADKVVQYPSSYNISPGGVEILPEILQPVGTKGTLTIIQSVERNKLVLSISCRVVRILKKNTPTGRPMMRLQFNRMTKNDLAALQTIININFRKRFQERVPFYSVVRWVTKDNPPEYPESYNISEGGICISTDYPSNKGDRGVININQKRGNEHFIVNLDCKIVRIQGDPLNPKKDIIGLEFLDMDKKDILAIKDVIESNRSDIKLKESFPFLVEMIWEEKDNKIQYPEIRNISMIGAEIIQDNLLPIGMKGVITLIPDTGDTRPVLSLKCEITRSGNIKSKKIQYWHGVKFFDLSQQESLRLSHILNRQK